MGILSLVVLAILVFAALRWRTNQPIIPEEVITVYSWVCKYSKLVLVILVTATLCFVSGSGIIPSSNYTQEVLDWNFDLLWIGIIIVMAIAILQPID